MAIKRPDIYEHNNPVLAIVDSDFLKGGGRVVADLTALYALSSRPDQLKERVTRVYVTAESAYYVLVDDANIGTSAGWEVESSGGGTWGSITGTLSDQTDLQSALDAKEPTITAGTTSQYYRGDKSFQTLDKAAVGLSNVDNTSDLNKPISTATQSALDAKEPTITAGTTSQYYRGDKSFQTLDKTAVGLSNVDNTSDLNKPISTATQTALDTKVDENAAIVGATKTKITYDAKGLVTAGADLAASDLPSAIDATKIADGTVSNAEFQYLGGVTSDVQTQLNDKIAKSTGTTYNVFNLSAVTQAEYDAIVTPDADTIYFII